MKEIKTRIRLGDVIKTQKGYAFKSDWFIEKGRPIVKVSNFTMDSIDFNNLTYISVDIAENYNNFKIHTDDIIIQTVGSWPKNPKSVVGKVIKVPLLANGALLNQNAVRIDPIEKVNKLFLYYLLKGKFKNYIIKCASGAANQASITLNDIRNFEFDLPNIEVQERISKVLSPFDYLIQNNAHRIRILQEIGRLTYKEWFENFNFPYINKNIIERTKDGKKPKNWEFKKINDVVETIGGGTPSTKNAEYWKNGTIVWFTPSDLTSSPKMFIKESSRKINELGLSKSSAKLFPAYSVMMTSRATIGVVAINTIEACTNQGFIICIPNEILPPLYLYNWILSNINKIIQHAGGTTFKEITKTTFRNFKILVPSKIIIDKYVNIINPIYKLIQVLLCKNKNLIYMRDMLIKKSFNNN